MSLINRIHEEVRRARITRRGATMHPHDAKAGGHKEYPRMPRTHLPKPERLTSALDEAIQKRRSFSAAVSFRACTKRELGTLLGIALGAADTQPLRNYPSGGALFPVETYIAGNVIEDHEPGVFHYHPGAHALEHLWDLPGSFSTREITTTPDVPAGSMLFIFTSVWKRSSAKYGNLAYAHALIEAGHMAQNLALTATAMRFATRPLAGFDDDKVISTLDIDEEEEQPLYTMVLVQDPVHEGKDATTRN